jgi:lysozyme
MSLLNVVIDLSHHNQVGGTGFHQVKETGVLGVIHKATQSLHFVDAEYHERRARALAEGLLWGAYHFASDEDPQAQAHHFLDTVNPESTDLLVLDFEPNSTEGTMSLVQAEAFVAVVKQAVGRLPVLYSGQAFLTSQVANHQNTTLKDCPLWIAIYPVSASTLPKVPSPWIDFALWQYTDGNAGPQPHTVPGVGRCDRDKFNGTIDGLKTLWAVQG